MEFKLCPKCSVEKLVSEFSKNRNRKDGLQYQCKACFANRFANLSEEELEAKRARERGWYSRMSDEQRKVVQDRDFDRYHNDGVTKIQRRESGKRYYESNKDKWTGYVNAYRARKHLAEGSHTNAEWLEIVAIFGHKCAYCKKYSTTLTRDHVVPLSRGGTDWIENIVPACDHCNNSKGTLTGKEFAYGIQRWLTV